MHKRMQYTQDEWLLLSKAPVQVGMAVMGVGDTSPIQIVRELIGIGQALRETSQTGGATALIRELNVETQAQLNELSQQQATTIDFAQIRTQVRETCIKVAAIVNAKESATAAQEYKRWLLWIGRRVAGAAREDQSQPISTDERALLETIAAALGMEKSQTTIDQVAAAIEAPTDAFPSPMPKHELVQAAGQGVSMTTGPDSEHLSGSTDTTSSDKTANTGQTKSAEHLERAHGAAADEG
jgi:hypothetical protein